MVDFCVLRVASVEFGCVGKVVGQCPSKRDGRQIENLQSRKPGCLDVHKHNLPLEHGFQIPIPSNT